MTPYKAELAFLWRISKTALSDSTASRYDRMRYVQSQYLAAHPEANSKALWLDITAEFRGYGL